MISGRDEAEPGSASRGCGAEAGQRLGKILLDTGKLSPEHLAEALNRQQALAAKRRYYPLGRILVALGYLDADQLSAALTVQEPIQLVTADDPGLVTRITSDAIRIQEEERRRISLELHDDIAQILGNLVLMMDACLAIAPPEAAQLRRYLANTRDTAKGGFRRVQRFALDLRPPMLDDLGLAPTVAWYAERFTKDTNVEVDVRMPEALPELTSEQETALFRIVQEALQNVRKHALAKRVEVMVDTLEGWLRLTVTDDGIGFDSSALLRRQAEGTHLGIAGMRYRTGLLGGRFSWESAAGKGARIAVEIPLPAHRLPDTGSERGADGRAD